MMIGYFKNLSKIQVLIVGLVTVVILGFTDYLTSVEYSFAIFYLLPITFVTWHAGRKYGLFIAIVCTAAWLNADMQLAERYSSATAPYWNALVRFGLFVVVVYLLSELKKMEETLEQKISEKTSSLLTEIHERKKTEEELKKQSEKLTELARRIQNIKEEENTRIAREIHDELGQAMTAIKMDLMWLSKKHGSDMDIVENLRSITHTVDDTIKIIRQISSSLRPRLLDELGFAPAIERYLKDFETKTGICYDLKYSEEPLKFSSEESNALFRIFQESLTNITRHSKASSIEIRFYTDSDGCFNMTIRDDGTGLKDNYDVKKESLGIIGMKERASSIGGVFRISSNGSKGTTVNIKLPNQFKLNNEYHYS